MAAAAQGSLGGAADQLAVALEQLQQEQAGRGEAAEAREAAVAAAARLERRVALLGQERDGLKRILASYQQDTTGHCDCDLISHANSMVRPVWAMIAQLHHVGQILLRILLCNHS